MLSEQEIFKINSLLQSQSKYNRKIFDTLSTKSLKHLANTAYNINHGNVDLDEETLSRICKHKQCMLCLGNPDATVSIHKRKVFINNQKGQGFFTVLLPILASVAIAALSHGK